MKADEELLSLLAEELGEAVQAVGKALRHGLHSVNPIPGSPADDNAEAIERELGDVMAAGELLVQSGVLCRDSMQDHKIEKLERVQQWLHSARNVRLAKACHEKISAGG
jgi:NTP pyrophosphatase (non-canonical NTP hydrolase)